MQKRILALGQDAYRAGAQIVFLHILGWLRENHDADISLVLRTDGELLDEYAKVLPTRVLHPSGESNSTQTSKSLSTRVSYRLLRKNGSKLTPGSFDLVYANTTASARVAANLAAEAGCPVICHVHELEMSIRRFAPRFGVVSAHLDGYIAVSRAVERNLVEHHGIDPDKIDR